METITNSAISSIQGAQILVGKSASRISASAQELSNTDLATETGKMIVAKHGFTANTKVIKVADEMLGTIIDLKG